MNKNYKVDFGKFVEIKYEKNTEILPANRYTFTVSHFDLDRWYEIKFWVGWAVKDLSNSKWFGPYKTEDKAKKHTK